MGHDEGPVGVDLAAGADLPAGRVPAVGAAAARVAARPPAAVPVARVQGAADDVLVRLQGVVFRATDAAHVVCVAVPVPALT